jgi:hypothetical protein
MYVCMYVCLYVCMYVCMYVVYVTIPAESSGTESPILKVQKQINRKEIAVVEQLMVVNCMYVCMYVCLYVCM